MIKMEARESNFFGEKRGFSKISARLALKQGEVTPRGKIIEVGLKKSLKSPQNKALDKKIIVKRVEPIKSKATKNKVDEAKKLALETEMLILEHRVQARKLSRSILRRWRSRLDLEELDSLVDIALCEAAAKFNPNKGASFMTFYFYHLHGFLVKAIDQSCNSNTVPASSAEIAELPSDYNSISIKNGVHRVGTANDVVNALSNKQYLLPDEMLYKKEISEISSDSCKALTDLQKEVLYRIYNLDESTVDIAGELGYSRCHISRVKRKAFEHLYNDLTRKVEDYKDAEAAFLKEDEEIVRRAPSRRKVPRKKVDLKFKQLARKVG